MAGLKANSQHSKFKKILTHNKISQQNILKQQKPKLKKGGSRKIYHVCNPI